MNLAGTVAIVASVPIKEWPIASTQKTTWGGGQLVKVQGQEHFWPQNTEVCLLQYRRRGYSSIF